LGSGKAVIFTESLIREMSRVAARHHAINLAQGFPDWDPPAELVAAAKTAMDAGRHQYAVTWGSPELRTALGAKLARFMGVPVDPDRELVVTCGATEAMMVAMMTVCDPGDRVGLFSPFYENYGADAILSGAKPVHVALHPPHYRFDPDELRRVFASGLKAFVLCNPSNPCGRVFTRAELEQIAALAEQFDVCRRQQRAIRLETDAAERRAAPANQLRQIVERHQQRLATEHREPIRHVLLRFERAVLCGLGDQCGLHRGHVVADTRREIPGVSHGLLVTVGASEVALHSDREHFY